MSADSVVPGSASGSMDGVALKPLTVDFHEPGFATTLAGENAQPFRFQMSSDQRQQAGDAGGPINPQALNRYSYVLNNPVNGVDPTGHHYKVEPGGGGKGPGGGGGGRGTSVPAVASPPLRGGSKPGTYYDGGRYVPSTGQAAGDAATIAVGAALIADGVQQTAQQAQDSAESTILQSSRIVNPPWSKLRPYRGKTKTNGQTGKNRRYYEKDYTHRDVEVYDSRGKHLGSMDPDTGKMTKGPKEGRDIGL